MTELRAERVVVHRLEDRPLVAASRLDYLADVAEVVPVIVLERDVVLAGVAAICSCLAVALLELQLVDAAVPQREASAQEVVRGVRAQDLRGEELPDAADGNSDVRHRREVCDAQLLARRAVDVPRHAAVRELDADGVVQAVVVYPRYPAPGVAHEGARAVVVLHGLQGVRPVGVKHRHCPDIVPRRVLSHAQRWYE